MTLKNLPSIGGKCMIKFANTVCVFVTYSRLTWLLLSPLQEVLHSDLTGTANKTVQVNLLEMWIFKSYRIILWIVCLCILHQVRLQTTFLDSGVSLWLYRAIRKLNFNLIGKTGEDGSRLLQEAKNLHRIQERIADDVPFPCNVTNGRSAKVPTSVHQLRPGDVDVIAAMGDSLIAGVGLFASNVFHILVENRGASALGGGQGNWRQYLTLPNILKEFNPNLIGYAKTDALTIQPESRLNVAEIGAMSKDMPYMAKILVKRIKNDPTIDVKKHWKYITFMVGPNDFCSDICWIKSPWIALKNHKQDLIETLRILRDNLPRTFVGLIPPPHLQTLVEIDNPERFTFFCDMMTNLECSCLFGLKFRHHRQEYYDVMRKWQEMDMTIAKYPEFQTNDFTVMVQPMTVDLTFPETPDGWSDPSYISGDCFHISQRANARLANGVWNNLLEPVNNKSRNWNPAFEKFLCPTSKNPYLTTWHNSRGNNELS